MFIKVWPIQTLVIEVLGRPVSMSIICCSVLPSLLAHRPKEYIENPCGRRHLQKYIYDLLGLSHAKYLIPHHLSQTPPLKPTLSTTTPHRNFATTQIRYHTYTLTINHLYLYERSHFWSTGPIQVRDPPMQTYVFICERVTPSSARSQS